MSEILTQQVVGRFRDLNGDAESESLQISLSQRLALYEDFQVNGNEKSVALDEQGNWQIELLDTDGMTNVESAKSAEEVYYIFEINGRIYKKLVPVGPHCRDFNDLPNKIF